MMIVADAEKSAYGMSALPVWVAFEQDTSATRGEMKDGVNGAALRIVCVWSVFTIKARPLAI
jgi:hypothetical protein